MHVRHLKDRDMSVALRHIKRGQWEIVLMLEGRVLEGWSGWELPVYGATYPNRAEAVKEARKMGVVLANEPSDRYWAVLHNAVAACKSMIWSMAGLVA